MDSFIEGQREAGELDSRGSFTVDSVGALRKTLASALPEPHYYLFQIVQALLAGGACDIEVAIGRQSTRLAFRDVDGVFADLAFAKERLFQGLTLSSNRPLDLLLTGMATAVGSEMDRVDLHSGSHSLQLSLDDARLVERGGDVSALVMHRSVSKGLSFAWTRIWGARSEEDELQRRFEFAVPVVKVAGLAPTAGSCWRKEMRGWPKYAGLVLVDAAIVEAGGSGGHAAPVFGRTGLAGVPEGALHRLGARHFDATGLALASTDGSRRRWTFCATMSGERLASVRWIRNGMVVESGDYDLGRAGLLVLAPADGLDTDASGYALVRNEKFDARLAEARELAGRTLGSFSRDDVLQLCSAGNVNEAYGLPDTSASSAQSESLREELVWA